MQDVGPCADAPTIYTPVSGQRRQPHPGRRKQTEGTDKPRKKAAALACNGFLRFGGVDGRPWLVKKLSLIGGVFITLLRALYPLSMRLVGNVNVPNLA